MFSKPPVITDMGITLLLRAANGVKVTFTKFQAGKGFLDPGETEKSMTALKSVAVDDIGITAATGTEEQGYLQLEGRFDNQNDVEEDFLWTELGLIARIDSSGEDDYGEEYLYAYGYDGEYAEMIRSAEGATIVEQNFSAIIAIGDSENVTAYVIPGAAYASREDFEAHVGDLNNPHQVTIQQIGAAAAGHKHAASDINSGTLQLNRGGTGVTDLPALKALLGIGDIGFEIGYFVGDNTLKREISLGFKPSRVFLFLAYRGNFYFDSTYARLAGFACTFAEGDNYYHDGCDGTYRTKSWNDLLNHGHGGAAVTNNGFAVGYYDAFGNTHAINMNGQGYFYIALK